MKRNVQALEKAKQSEQADVDRLEGRTLAAFFYNAIGKMEEKLTQERREAYAAGPNMTPPAESWPMWSKTFSGSKGS